MKSPIIRLLYFTREEFPTYRVDIDELFGSELIGRGHKIDFVMQAQSTDIPTGPTKWRGRTVFVGATHAVSRYGRLMKQLLGVWHDLRSLKLISPRAYDAVQVRDKFVIAAIALFVAHRRDMKFFFWLSFPFPESDISRARARAAHFWPLVYLRGICSSWLLYRWILPHCDHAFVQSRQMRKDVCAYGIDPLKVTPVPMGIGTSDLLNFGQQHGDMTQRREVTLTYLGTLNTQRRLEILIDTLAILRGQALNVKLLCVGDGDSPSDRRKLESRAEELGVREHLQITGFLTRAEALSWVLRSDICISPFFPTPILQSTSPTKLVEYMALGLPVVANDHPEQRLILRESRAGVCVPWRARHFARAIRWLLKFSKEERLKIGARGRAWVEAHRSYSRIADDIENKYAALLR